MADIEVDKLSAKKKIDKGTQTEERSERESVPAIYPSGQHDA